MVRGRRLRPKRAATRPGRAALFADVLRPWTAPPGSCEPLCFFPEKPVELSDKESLLVSLKQVGRRGGQILGHFRLWVTADRAPHAREAEAVEVPLLP